jgi:flagellin-specific chaperone FliS
VSYANDKAKYYAKMQIETSAKPRIICMLHERCVQLLRQAVDTKATESGDMLVSAQNIIVQLECALRIDDDVSESLFHLYDFCYVKIDESKDGSLRSALNIMTGLRDLFDTVSRR